jgi:multidrug resistance efflux pump
MKAHFFSTRTMFVGLVLLGVSLVGTVQVLHTRAGDAPTKSDSKAAPTPAGGEGAVCIGHVDVEYGVRNLFPVQLGSVEAVLVQEDETVKGGAPLLRVDDQPARFLLRQAQADLKAAQLRLTEARKLPRQYELQIAQQAQAIEAATRRLEAARHGVDYKKELLEKGGFGAKPEVKAAEALVKELEAAEKAAREKLTELQLRDAATEIALAEQDIAAKQIKVENAQYGIDKTVLRAPFDGKVLRILVGPGDVLSAAAKEPAIQFAPLGPRIVRAEVEQEFAGRVVRGQTALIQDDSRAGPTWQGKVVRISDWYTHRRSILQEPLQFNDVRTLECIIQLDPSAEAPRIGQRVRVSLGQTSLR